VRGTLAGEKGVGRVPIPTRGIHCGTLYMYILCGLKVHKHEIILNFFGPKSKPYIPLVNFRKKFRFFSFDFRQNFEVRTFLQRLSIRGTRFFWRDIKKKFFSKSSL
jgi:hypothetical protein